MTFMDALMPIESFCKFMRSFKERAQRSTSLPNRQTEDFGYPLADLKNARILATSSQMIHKMMSVID